MSEEERLAEIKGHLELFLKNFEEYSLEVFGERRRSRLDTLRAELQLKESLITSIFEQGFSGRVIGVGNGAVSISDLLPSALMGGNNEETHNFYSYDTVVKSLLHRALGKIESGLWPPNQFKPTLVINDKVLSSRCTDLLEAPGNYDRVLRESTTVLEDRIRQKPPHAVLTRLIPNSNDQQGKNLIDVLLNPNTPVISVSSDKAERIKFRDILVGILSYLRNPYHHHLDDNTEWSWAWSTVGFIDTLLNEIDNCVVTMTQ